MPGIDCVLGSCASACVILWQMLHAVRCADDTDYPEVTLLVHAVWH